MEQTDLARVAAFFLPGSKILAVQPLTGGISAQMIRLDLLSAEGDPVRVVLRRHHAALLAEHPQATACEFRLLAFLHTHGLPVPKPRLLDESGRILPQPYLLLDYLDGRMNFTPDSLEGYVGQAAAALGGIHRLAVDRDRLALPAETGCAELRRTEPGDGHLRAAIRHALAAAGGPAHPNRPVLLHGDYWPGNILWQNGTLIGIVDWEDAAVGDPLLDVARTRSELAWIFGEEAVEIFTAAYRQEIDLDWRDLAYWDLCAGLRQLRFAAGGFEGMAAYFAGHGRMDLTATGIERDLRRFIDQALEELAT